MLLQEKVAVIYGAGGANTGAQCRWALGPTRCLENPAMDFDFTLDFDGNSPTRGACNEQ